MAAESVLSITSDMPDQTWVYRARLERVVDGDTVDVVVDAGFHGFRRERLRLLGVNAPEVHGATKAEGAAATEFTRAWFATEAPAEWPLVIQTEKSDAFGRFLAVVWRVSDRSCLNRQLLRAGYAVPFDG